MDFEEWATDGALGGRYVLGDRLGAGRNAAVYAADDLRLRRRVAVKICHAASDADARARFAAEAKVLAGLSHPGLVAVYDICLDNPRPYLVMPLIAGGSLTKLPDRDPLEPAAVARIGAQVAEVLAYAHERGIVHGNVGASDVLVDTWDTGYLTGFGGDRGLGGPAGDVYALGMMLAERLPLGLGPEWHATLTSMTARDPAARPDAARAGELLRNIAAGDTAAFPVPDLSREPAEPSTVRLEPVTRRMGPAPRPARRHALRPTHARLAGVGLAATALAVLVGALTADPPAGAPAQPQVEQPAASTPPATGENAEPGTVAPARPAAEPGTRAIRRSGEAPARDAADESGPGKGKGRGAKDHGKGAHKGKG